MTGLLHEEGLAGFVRAQCREFFARGSSNKNSYFRMFWIEWFLVSFLMGRIESSFFHDSLRWFMVRRGTGWRVSVDLCESIHGCGVLAGEK